MNKNIERFSTFIDALKQENIEIYNIKMLPEYWGEEENRRMHFKIKGLKNWLWGAWLVESDNPYGYEFKVFCQYERFVDKFKPGRGAFNLTIIPTYEYTENGEKNIYFDLWDFTSTVDFIRKHPAMAFCYEDDITSYNGELWAQWKMFRLITGDMWYDFSGKCICKSLHIIAAIFSNLKSLQCIYCPDQWNKNEHINDDWFVLPLNKIGKIAARMMQKLVKMRLCVGSVYIEKDESDMLWRAYDFSAARQKYPLEKAIEYEDGSIDVDEDELWAVIHQMDSDDVIQIYGDI